MDIKPITKVKLKFYLLIIVLSIGNVSRSQVLESDSLALVALYNATDGTNWDNNSNWLIEPVDEWNGVTTTGNRVTLLGWLSGNGLIGSLPPELGNLSELRTLYLQGNELTGLIPSELGNLSKLESLYLYNNQLFGSIPPELGNLSALKELIMSNNQLTGQIPGELGNLSNLTELTLSQNQLSGNIPKELGNLTGLRFLLLWNNALTGEIPTEMGNLSIILRLNIYDNQLEGEIPEQLGNLALIRDLIFNKNNLSGGIPSSFSQLTNLLNLNISENQLKDLPDLSNLTQLTFFDVSLNCFGDDDIQTNIDVITDNIGQNSCSENITINTQPTNIVGCDGDNVSFSVAASGTTNLQYQWQQDQGSGFMNLTDQGSVAGSNTDQLTISDIQPSMDGIQFRCVVSGDNADDATSNEAGLMVIESIDITSHPASKEVSSGQSINFTILTEGDAPSYQWMKDGSNIAGATSNKHSIGSVSLLDAGVYQCEVTNDCGTVISSSATLTIDDTDPLNVREDLLIVYPNPSYGQLHIDGLSTDLKWSITFMDLSGKKVEELHFSERSNLLDISSFSKGIYWLDIRNDQERIHSQRIVLK
ncbi:leucine-rich repeat domain-containing protein [Ekhidna sp.]|uniref:leucine-rich repeat domain-containing protein n=1 Tax=Ekhidna sp. TaxID=2608089 RepID=UPI003C7A002A